MNGQRFVSHIKGLGIPGAENLIASDYDWLFLTGDYSPLATFLEWFVGNVMPTDILTDEQLREYEELKSEGSVLTSHELERMEACFSVLPTTFTSLQEDNTTEKTSTPEEHERLESQLDILNKRKNQLSVHKMELREEAYESSERLEVAEAHLKAQQEAVLILNGQLTQAQEDLAASLDTHINVFQNFDSMQNEDEVKFLSQLNLTEWHQEEAKFTDTLKTFIRRQFKEGVGEVAGAKDTTEYLLLDVDKLDLHLVRGAGRTEYAQNVAELNRLNKLLRQTEDWKLESLILLARRQAEVEEANKYMAFVHRNQLPASLPLLQQKIQEASESRALVDYERGQQQQVLQSLVMEVSQLESTRTICGNYQLKLQRQEYFLQKQNIVMDQLLAQMARFNWMNIFLDQESCNIGDIMEVLQNMSSIIIQRDINYKERMKCLESQNKTHGEQKMLGQLPSPLLTLSHLLPPTSSQTQDDPSAVVTAKTLQKQIAAMQQALASAQEQLFTSGNPQFSRLSRMAMNCAVLETGLFGDAGRLGTLPMFWLDPKLVERYSALSQQVWEFKQKLLKFICEHEEKKKILQIDPTMRRDFMKWTTASE